MSVNLRRARLVILGQYLASGLYVILVVGFLATLLRLQVSGAYPALSIGIICLTVRHELFDVKPLFAIHRLRYICGRSRERCEMWLRSLGDGVAALTGFQNVPGKVEVLIYDRRQVSHSSPAWVTPVNIFGTPAIFIEEEFAAHEDKASALFVLLHERAHVVLGHLRIPAITHWAQFLLSLAVWCFVVAKLFKAASLGIPQDFAGVIFSGLNGVGSVVVLRAFRAWCWIRLDIVQQFGADVQSSIWLDDATPGFHALLKTLVRVEAESMFSGLRSHDGDEVCVVPIAINAQYGWLDLIFGRNPILAGRLPLLQWISNGEILADLPQSEPYFPDLDNDPEAHSGERERA